jgi:hypothetical protein
MAADDTALPAGGTGPGNDRHAETDPIPKPEPTTRDATGTLVGTAVQVVETDTLDASMSAIASARTTTLSATGSAVGFATVEGDAETRLSWVGVVAAKGTASVHQSYASAVIAGSEVGVSQGGAPLVIGRTVTFDQGGSVVALATEANVRRGFIGVLLAGRADLADDTKVLMTGRALLVIAAVLLGGFGLVALAALYGANRLSHWRPDISLPELPDWLHRR